jgi:hypothetical protein
MSDGFDDVDATLMASKGCVLVSRQPRHQQGEEAADEEASTGSADTEPCTQHVSRHVDVQTLRYSRRSMESGVPDCGFGRCDGHHKMIDFRLEKSSGLGLLHLRLFTRRVGGWRRE